MKTLIPVLSEKEKADIAAYYAVHEKYGDEFARRGREDLRDHPLFGKLVREIPAEITSQREQHTRALQREAVLNNNWLPYIENQLALGRMYAKMGLEFKAWYEVIVMVKRYITPYLQKEYPDVEQFLGALSGMNRFMDITMAMIGEAYMREKQEIIQEDQRKIEKLNEGLEHKIAERTAELQRSNSIFQDLFRYNPAALTINHAEDRRIIDCNQAFLDLFRFQTKEEVIGHTSTELNLQTNRSQVEETVKLMKEQDFVNGREICVKNKQGDIIWVASSILKIDLDHRPCFLTVSIDITERKKAEEELVAANKELEAFSYSVSHDLRAPLRAIQGFSKILLEDFADKVPAEGQHSLNVIVNNSRRMGVLIDDLLAFSRLGRKSVVLSRVNMEQLVNLVIEDETAGRTSPIEFHVGELLPAMGEQSLLRQVWTNLISNAMKYSRHKDKTLIEIGSYREEDHFVYFIKDNGSGFDMQYYDKLFGVFQRLHSQDEFEGTGIGLAIVQRIVRRHGGTVWAKSKLDEGAAFYFTLPDQKLSTEIS